MNCPNEHGTMELKKVPAALDFRGEHINFVAEHYVCPVCSLEADDMALAGRNQRIIADAYRKAAGLLTGDEIVSGRKERGWTQEQLAKAMGVGVTSVKRWETGQIQTRVMDNTLRKVLAGDSSSCCDPYTGNRPLSLPRIKRVLKSLGELLKRDLLKQKSSDRMLYSAKYLWYADMVAFRETGQSMTGATYAALPQGPQLNNYRELVDLIREADEASAQELTDYEKRILVRIAMRFPSDKSVYDSAHKEPAWKNMSIGHIIPYLEANQISSL